MARYCLQNKDFKRFFRRRYTVQMRYSFEGLPKQILISIPPDHRLLITGLTELSRYA